MKTRMSENGERVRDFRGLHGLTQAELAKRIGVSQPLLSQVERSHAAAEHVIEAIISEFDIGPAFFTRGRPGLHNEYTGSVRYRRRSRTKTSATKRATGLFTELYDSVNVLAPHVGLTSAKFNQLHGSATNIEAAARVVRAAMKLDEFERVAHHASCGLGPHRRPQEDLALEADVGPRLAEARTRQGSN